MQILEQFKVRYGDALEKIYQRRPISDNHAMLLVILNKPGIKGLWRFLDLLEREHKQVEEAQLPDLNAYLDRLYALKRTATERRFRIGVNAEYEKMANSMLRFEEETHLMEYEIGIDMYQRVHMYHVEENQKSTLPPTEPEKVAVYAFQGEFWNDELDDYEVMLPDKCQKAEEWDIFFK